MCGLGVEHPVDAEQTGFVAGLSPAMQTLESVIVEIAPTNIPILFIGESGTGKEVFANRVHRLSRRCEEPFLKVSCASVNPATLFGLLGLDAEGKTTSDRGAGTTFFDGINELDAACQRHLLYALPDGDVGPRNGLRSARIVSATSRSLDEETRAGRFRSELFYRINGICLRLPPLRDRKEDIPLLVEWFLTKHAGWLGRPRPSLSPRTLRRLMDHSWPGNVRELENAVKKIVALGDEGLAVEERDGVQSELSAMNVAPSRGCSLKAAARAASREAERELILKALGRTHWNRKRAAQELQISYKSLLYKLKQITSENS